MISTCCGRYGLLVDFPFLASALALRDAETPFSYDQGYPLGIHEVLPYHWRQQQRMNVLDGPVRADLNQCCHVEYGTNWRDGGSIVHCGFV